jgi:hypothetical protein
MQFVNYRFVLLIIMAWVCALSAQAQQGVHAAGAEGSGSGGSQSFTIGQVFFLSYGDVNTTLGDGVQQAYPTGVCPPGSEYATPQIFFEDLDGDGFGNDEVILESCNTPEGYVLVGGDCDETNPLIYPGAPEFCTGLDNNCDGIVEDDCPQMIVKGFQDIVIANGSTQVSGINGTLMGSVALSEGISRTFTIYNEGLSPLILSGQPLVAIEGDDASFFSIVSQPSLSTIPAGGTTSFTVRYLGASSYGYREVTLSIISNDPVNNPYTFVVGAGTSATRMLVKGNGIGIVNGDMIPAAADFTDFGAVNYNSNRTRTFAIHNLTIPTLILSGNPRVQIHGPDAHMFTVTTQPPSTITSYQNRQFQVRFDASVVGEFEAWVEIASNDEGASVYIFGIKASVLAPNMQMRYNSVSGAIIEHEDDMPTIAKGTDFGVRAVNSTRTHTFYVRNLSGGGILWLGGSPRVDIIGAGASMFQVATMPGQSISSGGNSMLRINYKPTAAGVHHATVRIVSNQEEKNPYVFDIVGATPNAMPWDGQDNAMNASDVPYSLSLYPNPAHNELFIEIDGNEMEDVSIELIDVIGRVLLVAPFPGTQHRLDISVLPPGMYMLKVLQKEKITNSLKFIKQ